MISHAPRLHRPRPPLGAYIDYIGYWTRGGAEPHQSRALPRGAATAIIDVGDSEHVDFFAADARTRVAVAPAFIAGAGDTSYVTWIAPGQTVMTVHFRPAGASAFLGISLGDLTNDCVGLGCIWGRRGDALRERLTAMPSVTGRITLLEDFLLARLRPDPPTLAPVLAAVERRPDLRVSDVAALTGLSPKRLITTFRNEVGLKPKTYLRIRRLQAALRMLDTGVADGAGIATELGYFDQAHLIREFRTFTSMTPTQYRQNRDRLPGHAGLAR